MSFSNGKGMMRIYLFRREGTDLYAFSVEKTGANIPRPRPECHWAPCSLREDRDGNLLHSLPDSAEVAAALTSAGVYLFVPSRC